MNESYKDVDINSMKKVIQDYKDALNNSSSDDVIQDLTNNSILQSDNNMFFVKTLEQIEDEKKELRNAITIYEKMVELIEMHNEYEDKVVLLNDEKNKLINKLNNSDMEEDKNVLEKSINNINDEIELYNKKMNEIRFEVETLSNNI